MPDNNRTPIAGAAGSTPRRSNISYELMARRGLEYFADDCFEDWRSAGWLTRKMVEGKKHWKPTKRGMKEMPAAIVGNGPIEDLARALWRTIAQMTIGDR